MEPSLDHWTTLFLVVSATGFFISIALFIKSREAELYVLPSLIIGLFSAVLFQYVLFWTNYQSVIPYFKFLPNVLLGLIPVLVIRFSNRLLNKESHPATKLLYIPPALGLVLNICFWIGVFPFESEPSEMVGWVFRILFLGINAWVVVGLYALSIFQLFRLQKNLEGPRKRYFRMMIVSLMLFTLAYASYFVLARFPFFNSSWDYAISIVMSATIYYLGGTLITKSTNRIFPEAKGTGQELLDEKSVDEFYSELDKRMRKECHYRKDDLRLEWLAEQMEIPRNYLSYIINSKSGTNFNGFINEYRMKEAAELLTSRTDLTVKDIYFQVGFSNKATFYQAFKKKYKCTPSEYRVNQKSPIKTQKREGPFDAANFLQNKHRQN
mgnify:CR=1 FL=1